MALLLQLAALITASHGLRVSSLQHPDCSQKGIQCTIRESNCMDISWIKPYNWTPSAPSSLEVRESLGVNDDGLSVPVLQIKWVLNKDSSIQALQGVEVSVLQHSTNKQKCVQFHFENTFPSQVNTEKNPWEFVFNDFEVNHSEQYVVTVQNLPRLDNLNSKVQTVNTSECTYKHTDSCCQLGFCWIPNMSVEIVENDLVMMSFDQLEMADNYRILVTNHKFLRDNRDITIAHVPDASRVNYSIKLPSPICFYQIEIWPVMPSCMNDCVRQAFEPSCPNGTVPSPPPSGPVKRLHLSIISASITLVVFGCIILSVLRYLCDNEKTPPPSSPPSKTFPIKDQKVWLIYSADHKCYVDVVIKFSSFLRMEWGIEVILDLLHANEIGRDGPMEWVCHQKSEMDQCNGSILVLCSRGTQEKWKAKQTLDRHGITVRGDTDRLFGDLFTAALKLIAPDFQKGLHNERYIVGYFEGISNSNDIPSLFSNSPQYNLMRDLQDVFFRIHKEERYHPGVRYDVPQQGTEGYKSLMKAVSRCRSWQEKNFDWSTKGSLPNIEEDCNNETDYLEGHIVRVEPIVRYVETVSLVTPVINEANVSMVVEPVIVGGSPYSHMDPNLSEGKFHSQSVQPLLEFESRPTYIHEPSLTVHAADHWQYVTEDSGLEPNHTSASEFVNDAFKVFQTMNPDFCANNDLASWNEPIMAVPKKEHQTLDEGYLSLDLEQ